MGTIRFYTDAAGNEECLDGHEGYVAHEVESRWERELPNGETHDYADLDETGTWWSGSWSADMPAMTLRYRPTCECGWKGPIFNAVESDRWRADVVDDPKWRRGYLPEECEDELMTAWDEHADALISERVTLDPIAAANQTLRNATDALHRAIRDARVVGRSWSEIGSQLGVSKQAAWERYRHIDERLTEGLDSPRTNP